MTGILTLVIILILGVIMYTNRSSLSKIIKLCLQSSDQKKTEQYPDAITSDQFNQVCRSMVVRTDAKNRIIDPHHRIAFDKPSLIDPYRQRLFNQQINEPDAKKEWRNAQKWWQDLYGQYIDENDQANESNFHEEIQPAEISKWVIENASHQHLRQSKFGRKTVQFIQKWHANMHHMNKELVNRHNLEIKKLLREVHPDRNGCADSCKTLIEWKEITKGFFEKTCKQKFNMEIFLQNNTSTKARPWHVWSLYLENQNKINIQKEKNATTEIKKQIAHTQKKLKNNSKTIQSQEDLIKNLRQKIVNMSNEL